MGQDTLIEKNRCYKKGDFVLQNMWAFYETLIQKYTTLIVYIDFLVILQRGSVNCQIDGVNYTHETVIHDVNFVNPDNPDIQTLNIENMWMNVKRKLRRQFGTSRVLFQTYLSEFRWRKFYRCPIIISYHNYQLLFDVRNQIFVNHKGVPNDSHEHQLP